MVKRLLTLLAILFFCLHSFAQDVKTDKMELKILYVGGSSDWSDGNIATLQHPDSVASRSGAFKELLEKYFTSVTLINGADYDYKLSEKYDVTIIDGKIPQLRDRIHIRGKSYKYSEYYRPIYFPQDYSAPTLFLAEADPCMVKVWDQRAIGTAYVWQERLTIWICRTLYSILHLKLLQQLWRKTFRMQQRVISIIFMSQYLKK